MDTTRTRLLPAERQKGPEFRMVNNDAFFQHQCSINQNGFDPELYHHICKNSYTYYLT